jgi:hypothetical protein
VSALLASASIGDTLTSFFNAVGQFFSDLAAVNWGLLLLGLVCFGLNLTLRSRAFFNSLRAAYPSVRFQWRRVWGAYWAAVGFNNVVPARGGDVIKLFLTRSSIPGSTYPTVAAAFFVESVFDAAVGVFVLIFAFTQGVFPKPPDFSKLNAFEISYFAQHFRFTLFLITLIAVLALVAFAVLSSRVKAFWARVRQGVTILGDRPRYLREVASLQVIAWLARFAAFRTCCSCSGSTRSPARFRSRRVAPAFSRRCWSRSSRAARRRPWSPPTRSGSRSQSPRSQRPSGSPPSCSSSASARSRR